MRIGDLARDTGKTVRALRYYEELGLLSPQGHTEGGFRLYQAEDTSRVRLIDQLQDLGFSLERIRGVLAAWRRESMGRDAAGHLQAPLEDSLKDVRSRIARLQQVEKDMEEALRFLSVCRGCETAPGRTQCMECEQGDHEAKLPLVIDALVR